MPDLPPPLFDNGMAGQSQPEHPINATGSLEKLYDDPGLNANYREIFSFGMHMLIIC